MKKIFPAFLVLSFSLPVCADFTATDSQNLADITADMDYVYSNVASIKRWVDIIKANLHGLIVDGNLLQRIQWIERYLGEIDVTADTYLPDIYDALVGIDSDVAAPLADVVSTLSDISDALDGFDTDLSLLANLSYLSTIHQDISDLHVTTTDGFGTTYNQLSDILSAVNGISFDDQVTALNNIAQTLSGLASDLQNGDVPVSDDLAGVIEDAIENALHDWNPTIDVGGGTIDANVDFSEFDYSYFVSADDFAGLRSDVADIRNDVNSVAQYLTLPNYSLDYSYWGWSVAPGSHMEYDSGSKQQRQIQSGDFFSVAAAAFQGLLRQGDSNSDALRQLIYLASANLSTNSSDSSDYSINEEYFSWLRDWPVDQVLPDSVEKQTISESNLSFKDMVYKYLTLLAKQGNARDQSLLQVIWSLKGTNASEVADFSSEKLGSIEDDQSELLDFEYFANDSNIGDKFRPPVAIDNVESSISRVKGVWSDVSSTQPQQLDFDFGQWHGFGMTRSGGVSLAVSVPLATGGQSSFYANFRKAAKFIWWGLFVSIVFFIMLLVVRLVHYVNRRIQSGCIHVGGEWI